MAIIDPNTISGIHARYKASSLALSNGANVTTWNDISGNNRNLTASGSIVYNTNAVNGKSCVTVNNGSLTRANFFTSPINSNRSIFAVWKMVSGGVEPIWDTTANFWLYNGTVNPQGYTVKMIIDQRIYAFAKTRSDGWHTFTSTSDLTNATYPVGLESEAIDFGSNRCTNNGSSTGGTDLEIPRGGSLQIAEVIFYNRKLTWTQHNQVQEYIANEYDTYTPITDCDKYVVNLGNSTTQIGYPYDLGLRLQDLGIPCINLAYSGGTIDTMIGQTNEIQNLVSDLRSRNKKVVICLHHGHNNSYGQSTIDHISGSQFANLRATGAKILAMTASVWHNNPGRESGRPTLNNWLRSPAALNYVDQVYDLGGTPEFGVYGDGTTTGSKVAFPALWADDVHPTSAGCAKIAQLVEPSVRSMFATMDAEQSAGDQTIVAYKKELYSAYTSRSKSRRRPRNPAN